MSKLPRVKAVTTLTQRRVLLEFTDGVKREIDLAPYLRGPVFESIRANEKVFRSVHVDSELGTIVWENGADIDPDVLYGTHQPAWMDKEEAKKQA
ncbi:MAG: DUF2442 domain-containing protein [bacterium]